MRRRAQGGFSIVEVLIALAIVATSIVVLTRGTSTGLQSAGGAEQQETALAIARSVLARAGHEFPLEAGERNGAVEPGFSWTISLVEHREAGDGEAPKRRARAFWVNVQVFWKDARSSRPGRVALSTLKPSEAP